MLSKAAMIALISSLHILSSPSLFALAAPTHFYLHEPFTALVPGLRSLQRSNPAMIAIPSIRTNGNDGNDEWNMMQKSSQRIYFGSGHFFAPTRHMTVCYFYGPLCLSP